MYVSQASEPQQAGKGQKMERQNFTPFALPTHKGWCVDWENGKTITKQSGKIIRCKSSYETTDKAKAEAKAAELRADGYQGVTICECIF